jgi:putative NADH-flavin reductase
MSKEFKPKKIVIFGASGTVGSVFIEEGLLRGHKVIGVSRDPSKFNIMWPGFTGIQGDVTDLQRVREIITGNDVVIVSVMGPPNVSYDEVTEEDKYTPRPEDSVQHIAALNMITVSRELGEKAPRIIQLTGGSTLYYNGKQLFFYFPKPGMQPEKGTGGYSIMWGHHIVLDTYLATKDVNWTIATMAPGIEYGVRGERTRKPFKVSEGDFEVDPEKLMIKDLSFVDFRKRLCDISAVDFGVAVFDEIDNPQFIRKRFTAYYI